MRSSTGRLWRYGGGSPCHLDGAEADHSRPRGCGRGAWRCRSSVRDRQADGAAEIDAVGAVVEVDQHGERMAGAGFLAHRARHLGGDLGVSGALASPSRSRAVRIWPRSRATMPRRNTVSAPEMGGAGGDLAAGEILHHRQRSSDLLQRRQDHALEGLVVLRQDEVADALAHLGLDRRQLALELALSAPRTVSLVSSWG